MVEILCRLLFVISEYTICPFYSQVTQVGKIIEYYTDVERYLEKIFLKNISFSLCFYSGWSWHVLVEVREAFGVIQQTDYSKCDRKKTQRDLLCHKVWRSSGFLTAQRVGASFRGNSEGNWKQSCAIWFLICSLPWQCKSNTVSEWNICRHKLYAQCNMDPVVNNMWVTLFPLKARWYI